MNRVTQVYGGVRIYQSSKLSLFRSILLLCCAAYTSSRKLMGFCPCWCTPLTLDWYSLTPPYTVVQCYTYRGVHVGSSQWVWRQRRAPTRAETQQLQSCPPDHARALVQRHYVSACVRGHRWRHTDWLPRAHVDASMYIIAQLSRGNLCFYIALSQTAWCIA